MAIPATAKAWDGKLDPSDLLDYYVDLYDTTQPLLEVGEAVASYTLEVGIEGVALGLTIVTGGGRDPSLVAYSGTANRLIKIWLQIDVTLREDPAFSGAGVSLPIIVTVTSDAAPSRRRQRTLVVKVVQQ